MSRVWSGGLPEDGLRELRLRGSEDLRAWSYQSEGGVTVHRPGGTETVSRIQAGSCCLSP